MEPPSCHKQVEKSPLYMAQIIPVVTSIFLLCWYNDFISISSTHPTPIKQQFDPPPFFFAGIRDQTLPYQVYEKLYSYNYFKVFIHVIGCYTVGYYFSYLQFKL